MLKLVAKEVGPDQLRHFTPAYDPWDQRLCLAPDGDLFTALRRGAASVATGEIAAFTAEGLAMADGRHIPADIIVTATGLKLALAGGVRLSQDGIPTRLADAIAYKGVMFGGIPNFASLFGYTNASWTLKADLASAWLCRLLNRMHRRGERRVVAQPAADVETRPFIDFSSGYIRRAANDLPKQGDRGPWRLRQSYTADLVSLRYGRLADGVLSFSR